MERLRDSRKAPKREVERAAILLRYAVGEGPAAIQQALGVSRPTMRQSLKGTSNESDKQVGRGRDRTDAATLAGGKQ
ncbi:MAG: helix-turn-helix domain-containing protein [Chromatiales bacterium]